MFLFVFNSVHPFLLCKQGEECSSTLVPTVQYLYQADMVYLVQKRGSQHWGVCIEFPLHSS